jgi:hypothetical protein
MLEAKCCHKRRYQEHRDVSLHGTLESLVEELHIDLQQTQY